MSDKNELSNVFESPFSDSIGKLEELLTQNGRAFLLGAGCSKCANLPLTSELTNKVLDSDILNNESKEILSSIRNLFKDSSPVAQIEDFLSELVDLLAIASPDFSPQHRIRPLLVV